MKVLGTLITIAAMQLLNSIVGQWMVRSLR